MSTEIIKREGYEIALSNGNVEVMHYYPRFDEPPRIVTIDIMHVRSVAPIRAWFDSDANEWVVEAAKDTPVADDPYATETTWKQVARISANGDER